METMQIRFERENLKRILGELKNPQFRTEVVKEMIKVRNTDTEVEIFVWVDYSNTNEIFIKSYKKGIQRRDNLNIYLDTIEPNSKDLRIRERFEEIETRLNKRLEEIK